jgi:DNA topoisomerase-1
MAKAAKKTSSPGKKTAAKGAARARAAGAADGRNLVVVESPAKARTINRYLGRDYVVKASMGHVRDLPTKQIGVDIANGFAPTYEALPARRKVLAELKKHAKTAGQVFLATDLDREGEAIAWHLAESLGVPKDRIRRVIFNEITRAAIREAFAHPRAIDMNKVNAQQARRILDRIVGYQVSPLLWRKVATGLSAGRVQSVTVRLIVDRQREIDAFNPEEYWKIVAVFTPKRADNDETV